jgi:hypothetical protein
LPSDPPEWRPHSRYWRSYTSAINTSFAASRRTCFSGMPSLFILTDMPAADGSDLTFEVAQWSLCWVALLEYARQSAYVRMWAMSSVAHWEPSLFSALPRRGVCHLRGATSDQLSIRLDPLPPGAPVVIRYRIQAASLPEANKK